MGALCLLDGDNHDKQDDETTAAGLVVLRWRRSEIENYLLQPAADFPIAAVSKHTAVLGPGPPETVLLLAGCGRCWHSTGMSVQIAIRGVPDDVRAALAARAAQQRRSMQEFLRGELERIASRPSVEVWLRGVRARKEATGTRVRPSRIVRAWNTDRT